MTIFGIGPLELLIIVVIALVVVGPERLPELMFQIGQGVNKIKHTILELRSQARSELGEDYEAIEQFGRQIRSLNPRQQIQEIGRSILDDDPITSIAPPQPPESTITEPAIPITTPIISDLARQALSDTLLDPPLDETLAEESPNDQPVN